MCHPSWGRALAAAQHLSDLARLRRVRDRIDREYAQPLDVEALARGVHMSAGHLSREFRRAYGESPYAYLMTRRIERAMAAIVESHHDDKEIVWPVSVAPFQVAIVVAQHDDAETAKAGEEIYERLNEAGVEGIIDDRPERAGVKFRDVELSGIPYRITRSGLETAVVRPAPPVRLPCQPLQCGQPGRGRVKMQVGQ
jgi:AraC-like DNA-binding protein